MEKNVFAIKEKSILAWLASSVLRTNKTAIVVGKTIHLHNATKKELLTDTRWLNHELAHIAQYKKYGLSSLWLVYATIRVLP